MTGREVNGGANGARTATRALTLLAPSLNATILRTLSGGAQRLGDLRRRCDSPAKTTLRAHLRELEGVGAIAKRRRDSFPGTLEYELESRGRDLLSVAAVLERWLARAPEGPLPFGSNGAKVAIKALAEAWSTTMLRALAAGPLSLTELDGIIGSLSYPSLERRLETMRLSGQVEPRPGNGRSTPYAVTDWLRQGVGPLAAAARWERRHQRQATSPLGRLDAEAIFLLAVPLLRPPGELSGLCQMAAEISNGRRPGLAGVTVEVEGGTILSCATRLQTKADAWALGSPTGWLEAVVDRDIGRLELGGDRGLARTLVDCLHGALFEVRMQPSYGTNP